MQRNRWTHLATKNTPNDQDTTNIHITIEDKLKYY